VFREQGEIAGVEADMARRLAEALGRRLEFVELPWEDQIAALEDRRIDIVMSGMSITRDRGFRVLFSYPYMRGGLTALVPRGKVGEYFGPLAFVMSEARVAVQRATTGDFFVQQNMQRAAREAYGSVTEAYDAVVRGKADMMIHDAPVLWWLASGNPEANLVPLAENLTIEYYAWAVRRDNTDLLEEVNAVLGQWKADGTLTLIVRKWLPSLR
jgi:ABC-type amino acid transport substrate-binding protein